MMKSIIVKTATKTATIIPTTFNIPHIVQKTVRRNYESYLKILCKEGDICAGRAYSKAQRP